MKLLIGGSPCTHWSIAQTKNRETEPEGLGWELFKNYLIALEKFKPDFFLYENNKSMAPAIRAQITRELGVEPILINSALVSAQNRQRLYWTDIPGVEQPEDLGILLRDILESGVCWREKAYTLRASIGQHGGTSSVLKTVMEPGKFSFNGAAEPVYIGEMPGNKGTYRNGKQPSQQYRVYSSDGKSLALCGNGGGGGAKTGLYAALVRVGDMPNADGIIRGGQAHRFYDADGKSATLTARPNGGGVDGPLYAVPAGMAWRGRGESSSYEMRDDQKANSVTAAGHQSRLAIEAADGKTYPVYEVRDGQITIKGRQYPIKLADGLYIIRKLTVTECKRLQTVPEEYIFPVSDTQAYKMLGNGWTVDVIAHILHYAPGITTEPLEVLSMYDGMSCGHLALDKLGAHIAHYYATEIDKYAIQTTQHNFPDTIQLGDAFQVREEGWRLPELEVPDQLPHKRYSIIYADPPWSYPKTGGIKSSRGMAKQHYQTMSIEEICALPVGDIAAGNCALFLWATFPQLSQALAAIEAWGFEYFGAAFVWVKRNDKTGKDAFGMGYWTRANPEVCLLAFRGKMKPLRHDVRQLVYAPARRHSEKPPEIRDKIVSLCGDLQRIELFARDRAEGWDAWGHELPDGQKGVTL